MSTELIKKTDKIISKIDIPDRSTFFQLKNFILGQEPTVHGQIWACIRNLNDRRDQIDALELQIDEAEDELKLLDIKIKRLQEDKSEVPFWDEEKTILVRKIERNKKGLINNSVKLKQKIKGILEEIQYFVTAYDKLVETAGEVKPLDDIQVQKSYWNEKLTEQLNLTLLLKRPINVELVQTIVSLDDDMPIKTHMMQILKQVQSNMISERDKQLSQNSKETSNVELIKK